MDENGMLFWSILLTIIGLLILYLQGNRKTFGLASIIGIFFQIPNIYYNLITKQYGFILASIVYGTIYFRNYLKNKKEQENEVNIFRH